MQKSTEVFVGRDVINADIELFTLLLDDTLVGFALMYVTASLFGNVPFNSSATIKRESDAQIAVCCVAG